MLHVQRKSVPEATIAPLAAGIHQLQHPLVSLKAEHAAKHTGRKKARRRGEAVVPGSKHKAP
jgi:hypothetical protein